MANKELHMSIAFLSASGSKAIANMPNWFHYSFHIFFSLASSETTEFPDGKSC